MIIFGSFQAHQDQSLCQYTSPIHSNFHFNAEYIGKLYFYIILFIRFEEECQFSIFECSSDIIQCSTWQIARKVVVFCWIFRMMCVYTYFCLKENANSQFQKFLYFIFKLLSCVFNRYNSMFVVAYSQESSCFLLNQLKKSKYSHHIENANSQCIALYKYISIFVCS